MDFDFRCKNKEKFCIKKRRAAPAISFQLVGDLQDFLP